jgi:NADH:ubiquinone oxidoreductase subunit D
VEGEPKPEEEDDLEKTIEARLRGIQVEQGPERKRKERAYEPFVGLRQAEESQVRWKEIGKLLANLKCPEGKSLQTMQQCRWEAMKYLVSDGVFCFRWNTNEPVANVLVRT